MNGPSDIGIQQTSFEFDVDLITKRVVHAVHKKLFRFSIGIGQSSADARRH
jgi:hypothetical protein